MRCSSGEKSLKAQAEVMFDKLCTPWNRLFRGYKPMGEINHFSQEIQQQIEIIKKRLRTFFGRFKGLECEFFDICALPNRFSCLENSCSSKKKGCLVVDPSFIEEIRLEGRPMMLTCPMNFKKIFIPLSIDNHVLALAVIGENKLFHFDTLKTEAFMELLFSITNYITLREETTTTQENILDNKLERVVKYIRGNYSRPLSLKEVAKENHISYHHLSRLFKRELNTGFNLYLNKIRIREAITLLGNSNLTINQIAYSVGFDDPGYFCKTFKKIMGCSPLAYRKKHYQSITKNV